MGFLEWHRFSVSFTLQQQVTTKFYVEILANANSLKAVKTRNTPHLFCQPLTAPSYLSYIINCNYDGDN